jgi:hypothetical protein
MAHEGGRDAASRGFYFRKFGQRLRRLFDLRFFVGDVLAHHGIEFLRLELVRVQALVLGGRVVMTCAGGRNQLDLVAHVPAPLNLDALGSQVRNHDVHAAFLNRAQTAGAHAKADEPLLGLRPKSVAMQIWQKAAALAIVRVRNRVTRFGAFARDLANSRHG